MGKELPKNWILSNIEDSIEILDNKRKPVSASERAKRIGDIPYYGATGVAGKIDDYIFDEELILLGEDGAPFLDFSKNVAYLISGKSWVNNHAHVLKARKNVTSNIFLLHFLNQFDYTNYVGGTTRLKLNQGNLKSIPFPLPPLVEQQRIVAKLDELFGYLDSLKTRLNHIPQILKKFRQAVLTQAVKGKLTEEWRVGKTLEKWKEVESSKIFEFVTSGSRGWAKYYNELGEQLFVRITNMNYGSMELDLREEKCQFLKLPDSSEGKRTLLQSRDILISITADIGMISLIQNSWNIEAYVNQHVCLARPIKEINEFYLCFYLMSEDGFGQLKNLKRGVTKAGLTLGDIKSLVIKIPSKKEQAEIVKRVEHLFAKADAIEAQYQSLKIKIDSLPQAILAKAFKGELVEQLDTDGDAKELLEEIQKLKEDLKPVKKTARRRKKT
ncbi:restriction endonuclease subunit S [Lacinutrix sp. Bg11-31]|uniref:restriction endonuclease subunit S n=1 Tax=Lacinutrix sp. Bg11-31 TaxID=2057808 RepID=UPI000C30F1A6|nr:restriction endonuclease subunit S [Lacinutrix sp. Bg11-31]AUC81797.1 restriction endonuclease subunit S [Lacinutrix sp. Bg11-31]